MGARTGVDGPRTRIGRNKSEEQLRVERRSDRMGGGIADGCVCKRENGDHWGLGRWYEGEGRDQRKVTRGVGVGS